MNQDYSNLYGAPKPTAPPPPPAPSPYNHEIPGQPNAPQPPYNRYPQGQPVAPVNPYDSDGGRPVPPPMPQQPARQAAPAYRQPAPPKPRQPFSPIPLLMIAGVAFLFLGGVIFLTNTWDTLPDMVRALSLLSLGVISFGMNLVAEKALGLPKTGLAFYILGCIFLPLAVAGIGAFSLFGEWFSFAGDGKMLVGTAIAACVAVSAFAGVKNYKHPLLAWFSLAAAAAAWCCLSVFISTRFALPFEGRAGIGGGVFLLLCVGSLVWSEWKLRTASETPWGRAALWYLIPLLFVTAFTFLIFSLSGEAPYAAGILALVLHVCFYSKRLIFGKTHAGVWGIVLCLVTAFSALAHLEVFADGSTFNRGLFVLSAVSFTMMAATALPVRSEAARKTLGIAGMVMSIPMILGGGTSALVETRAGYLTIFAVLMLVSILFFGSTKKHPLTEDTPYCALYAVQLFIAALLGTEEQGMLVLLMILGTVLLLIQAFARRRIWCFVLAAASCAGVPLLGMENGFLWIFWLCTAVSLTGVVYAHIAGRQLLEKCFAWTFIPALLLSGLLTMEPYMTEAPAWTLVLAAVTLLYLLEKVVLWKHERAKAISPYLEVISIGAAFGAFLALVLDSDASSGFGFVILLSIMVFSVSFVKKRNNMGALPHLLLLFFTVRHLIAQITEFRVVGWELPLPGGMTPSTAADLLRAGCFLLVLAGFALMGRLLLPKFFDAKDGFRLDLPLLMGVFPVMAAAMSVDWHPDIVLCLLLTAYSLLFIGRIGNRCIPELLASMFGCMALFLHNIHDPFHLIDRLMALDIQTLRMLLYVLPFHLFIFTLLFILPKNAKTGVHIARYAMYVVTMLCLLATSLNFGNVADAIILVVFSFAILVGSFAVKRLRWFTLGFAVLVMMTIHLTWEFWTSLHWGIYLFLAGILLIVIASAYEYSARYAKEHPDAPKKKIRLFSAWTW